MRALYANNRGETYLKEVPDPELGETGVLIETATSVLGTGSEVGNVSRARRAVQEGSDPGALREQPMSYQSAGRVVAVTPDLQSHYAPGDRVVAVGGGFAPHAERAFRNSAQFRQDPGRIGYGGSRHREHRSHRAARHSPRAVAAGRDCRRDRHGAGGPDDRPDGANDGRPGHRHRPHPLSFGEGAGVGHRPGIAGRRGHAGRGGGGLHVRSGRGRIVRGCGRRAGAGSLGYPLGAAQRTRNDDWRSGAGLHGGAPGRQSPYQGDRHSLGVRPRAGQPRPRTTCNARTDYPNRFVQWDQERNLYALLQMQASGGVRVGPLLTHRFSFADAPKAVDILIEHPDEALAVVLEY